MNKLNTLIPDEGHIIENPVIKSIVSTSIPLFKSNTEQNEFPFHINLSCLMTKPEDQGQHGTCMAFAGTTFVESLLWKLTGQKEEFTVDEMYNLYFDAWGEVYGTVDSLTRKQLRGEDGSWSQEWPYYYEEYAGLTYQRWAYYSNSVFEFSLTDKDDSGVDIKYKYSLYYWMMHYNDPDVRKNHYPDKFSILCEKAKNYLYKKIFAENGVSSDIVPYPMWNGQQVVTGKMYEVSPNRMKFHAHQTNMPMKASMLSFSGGHAVVFYDYDISSIYLNSSWDENSVWKMSFDYKNTTSSLSTDHYYSNFTSHSGQCIYIYHGIDSIDFYKETETPKRSIVNLNSFSGSGKIYGVRSNDKLDYGRKITLIAIPDDGYYFKCWDDQFTTGEWQSNVRVFDLTTDISITPWFTDNEQEIGKIMHSLYIMSSDYCSIQCNSYSGELLSGNVPLKTNLSCQDTKWKYNSDIELQVIPNQGYKFICWNDGDTANPRTYNLTSNSYAYPLLSSI